eukprot:5343328-Prymnesium_polylepis.1
MSPCWACACRARTPLDPCPFRTLCAAGGVGRRQGGGVRDGGAQRAAARLPLLPPAFRAPRHAHRELQ